MYFFVRFFVLFYYQRDLKCESIIKQTYSLNFLLCFSSLLFLPVDLYGNKKIIKKKKQENNALDIKIALTDLSLSNLFVKYFY